MAAPDKTNVDRIWEEVRAIQRMLGANPQSGPRPADEDGDDG